MSRREQLNHILTWLALIFLIVGLDILVYGVVYNLIKGVL